MDIIEKRAPRPSRSSCVCLWAYRELIAICGTTTIPPQVLLPMFGLPMMLSKKSVVRALCLLGSSSGCCTFSKAGLGGATAYPLTLLRRCQVGRRRQQSERHGLEVLHDSSEMELVASAGKAS